MFGILALNKDQSAAVNKPRFAALDDGILKLIFEPDVVMLKSVPDVPVIATGAPAKPLIEVTTLPEVKLIKFVYCASLIGVGNVEGFPETSTTLNKASIGKPPTFNDSIALGT